MFNIAFGDACEMGSVTARVGTGAERVTLTTAVTLWSHND